MNQRIIRGVALTAYLLVNTAALPAHIDTQENRCAKCEERRRKERIQKAQIILANIAQIAGNIITIASQSSQENPCDDSVIVQQGAHIIQNITNIIYQAMRTTPLIQMAYVESAADEQLLEPNTIYLALKSRGVSPAVATFVANHIEEILGKMQV